jgi:hypothetical protein
MWIYTSMTQCSVKHRGSDTFTLEIEVDDDDLALTVLVIVRIV